MDVNPNFEDSSTEVVEDFIGYIEQIFEIDFIHMKKTFIMCKWFGIAQLRPHISGKSARLMVTISRCSMWLQGKSPDQ